MPLVVDTDWVVMAKQPQTLEPLTLAMLGDWQTMPLYFDLSPWTDDFTNIVKDMEIVKGEYKSVAQPVGLKFANVKSWNDSIETMDFLCLSLKK